MAVDELPSGRFRSRIKQAGVVIDTQSFDLRADAEKWDAKTKKAVENGTWVDPAGPRTSIKNIAEKFLAFRSITTAPKTHETEKGHINNHIVPALGHIAIEDVTEENLLDLMVDVMAKHSESTASRLRDVLVSLYSYSMVRKLIDENLPERTKLPKSAVQAHKPDRPFKDEDLANTLALQRELNEDYALLTEFLVLTGLRWGEVCALTVGDFVHYPRPSIRVSKSKTERFPVKKTKSGRERRVPLSKRGIEIATNRTRGREANELMFTAPRGGPLNQGNYRRAIAWTRTAPNHRPHDLRHTAGANWIRLGIHIEVVSQWLGHSNVRITQEIYVNILAMVGEEESVNRLDS